MIVHEEITTPVQTRSELFPLPLSDFEYYMFVDDRPSHPMVFVVVAYLSGPMLRDELESAVHDTVRDHPLFACRVHRLPGRGWCWVPADATVKFEWRKLDRAPDVSDAIEIRAINLRQECGLQVVVDSNGTDSRMVAYLHHSCCDGIGGLQFIGEVLARYGRMTAPPGARPPEFEPPVGDLLTQREQFDTSRAKTERHKRSRKRLLGKIRRLIFRKPAPLNPLSEPSASAQQTSGRAIRTRMLPRTLSRGLRAFAARRNVSVNDVCIWEMMLQIHDWQHRAGQAAAADPWIRVSVPISMRTIEHQSMPACNMVSYAFVTRRDSECRDPDALLASVHQQTSDMLFNREGIVALKFLGLVRKVPGLMKLLLSWKSCFCTVVLANVGDVRKRFSGRFPLRQGRWIAGNVVVENLCGVAPVRPNTRAAVTVGDYGDQFGVHLRTDDTVFSHRDAELFLTEFTDRLLRLVDPESEADLPPESVS